MLPDPLIILTSPSSKVPYKKLIRSRVMSYWETKLRQAASPLLSLEFYHPQFYSLSRPHPIWSSAGSNPYEVEMRRPAARPRCCQAGTGPAVYLDIGMETPLDTAPFLPAG